MLHAGHAVGIILEGLGYSVYARIVPLQVVADLVGGTVRLAWRKLRPYIEEERRRSGSQKTFEWFQWLAVQLERYSPGKTDLETGAQEAYQNWKPKRSRYAGFDCPSRIRGSAWSVLQTKEGLIACDKVANPSLRLPPTSLNGLGLCPTASRQDRDNP